MKTMKKGDEIIRIKDNEYKTYLDKGYTYTSKSEYKKTRPTKNKKGDEKSTKRGKKSKN